MTQPCRYLIMAGGTGGHIFPAMAVAKELLTKGNVVSWLGTANGMERSIVEEAEIPLATISITGFRGKKILAKLLAPLRLFSAVVQSMLVMQKNKSQVVIGFGGYVSAPGGIAARFLGKKLIIHEQNSVAGSTNKLLSKLTPNVLEAFPGSLPNAKLVGNPVRAEVQALFSIDRAQSVSRPINLLITGGSLGALMINTIVPKVIKQLPDKLRPNIWHQTGRQKLAAVLQAYQSFEYKVRCEEFIDQVDEAYRWADIIICRAGALTVSEIAVAGVPAIFIPYPYAIDNHQYSNAKWLVDNEAALMIEQKDLTDHALGEILAKLLSDKNTLIQMSQRLKQLAMPDATEKVVSMCEQICLGEKSHAA